MFSKAVISLALAASAVAQSFSIATPASLVQCQPASISWTGGNSPFILSALPAAQVAAVPISFIATGLTASPYVWNVNLASGLNITLRLTDNNGTIAYASPLVIQAGTTNACLNASAVTSGLSTVSVSATGSASATGSVTGSTVLSSSSFSAVSSSLSASSASASAAATSSASATSSGNAASSVSSVAASTTSRAGAFATAVAGIPALAVGAIGAVAALL